MPKIISPETKEQVRKNHLSGFTRDENASNTGISAGAVTTILSQFSNDIGKVNYESITRYSRTLRENDMSLSDSIKGFHFINLIKRINIESDKLQEFITEVYLPYKDSKLTPSELINNTKRSVEFLKLTKMTPDEMEKYCNDILNKKEDLEKQTRLQEEKRIQSERETKSILKQNKSTLEKISNFEQTRKKLEESNISLDDLPKLAKMLRVAGKNNWSNSKIIDCLESFENYNQQIIAKKKELEKINEDIDEKTTQNILLDKKITSKELHQKKIESTVKTLKDQETELKASVRTMTELSLNQIKTITKNVTESISEVQSKYLDSVNTLNDDLNIKSDKMIKKQTDNLENLTSNLDEFISETIKSAEKAGNIRALVPFHKILDSKGEAHEIYPAMIMILERFRTWYQKQDNKDTITILVIKELIANIKKHLKQ